MRKEKKKKEKEYEGRPSVCRETASKATEKSSAMTTYQSGLVGQMVCPPPDEDDGPTAEQETVSKC